MFRWDIISQYLFSGFVLQAAWITLWVAVVAQFLGVVFGLVLALMRMSRLPILSLPSAIYIWLFRGSPVLVQILILFNGLPKMPGNIRLDPIYCVLVALALNEGAYMAEIVRAGISSVDAGQAEAARALGMRSSLAMRRIILPQALRVIIPPLGNEFNNMLKTTSLASVIGVMELTGFASIFGAPTFSTFELLIVATLYYLVFTTIWEYIQRFIEDRLDPNSKGKDRNQATANKNWGQRMIGFGSKEPVAETLITGGH